MKRRHPDPTREMWLLLYQNARMHGREANHTSLHVAMMTQMYPAKRRIAVRMENYIRRDMSWIVTPKCSFTAQKDILAPRARGDNEQWNRIKEVRALYAGACRTVGTYPPRNSKVAYAATIRHFLGSFKLGLGTRKLP